MSKRQHRSAAAATVVLLLALAAGACGGQGASGGRLEPGEVEEVVVGDPDGLSGPLAPEEATAAGFPPLETLEDPRALARDLLGRTPATGSWTVTWQLSDEQGREGGIFRASRLADESGEKLVLTGEAGDPGVLLIRLAILDEGEGPRGCMRQDDNPWVCEEGSPNPAFDFLSVDGFTRLGGALPDLIRGEKATVTYLNMAGVATACFSVDPQPITDATVGLDFSRSGSFCVSKDGVLMVLEAGEVNLRAFEYEPSADPAAFRLPVEP